MYGAAALPRISVRSWFSITIVNTVPFHPGGRAADVAVMARHSTDVLPELFAPQDERSSDGAVTAIHAKTISSFLMQEI
jgi:hypothetical protein